MVPHYVAPSYPVLNFIARAGMPIAALLGLAIVAGGLWLGAASGLWIWAAAGIVGGVVISGILASYVEVARIVLDTLVPR